MKRIRYAVAASVDGFIAGPKGEADWILMDPEIDFQELFEQFDTMFIGRGTYESALARGGWPDYGLETYLFSTTLQQASHPGVTIIPSATKKVIDRLRNKKGKDIWLMGGGLLFRSLLQLGLVDTVEVAVIPVLLGGGIPLLPPAATCTKLTLTNHRIFKKTGIVSLEYDVK